MPTGMVKWFNEAKSYGFIIPDEGGKDIFFHRSDMRAQVLREGQKVSYTIEEGRKGPIAVSVTPEDSAYADSGYQGGGYNSYNDYDSRGGGGYSGGGHSQDYSHSQDYDHSQDYSQQSYTPPPREPAKPARKTDGVSLLISDAKSICDAAEELALRAHDDTGHEQVLNLSVLIRSVKDKLDNALDILATSDL